MTSFCPCLVLCEQFGAKGAARLPGHPGGDSSALVRGAKSPG